MACGGPELGLGRDFLERIEEIKPAVFIIQRVTCEAIPFG
jgi:hypothetical protein